MTLGGFGKAAGIASFARSLKKMDANLAHNQGVAIKSGPANPSNSSTNSR
jgi:hypothetical protein